MLTRIDHVMICVLDLQHGIDAYTRLEFNVYPGGGHPGRGMYDAIAFHEEDYLELMSVRDRQEYLAAALGGGLVEFLPRRRPSPIMGDYVTGPGATRGATAAGGRSC